MTAHVAAPVHVAPVHAAPVHVIGAGGHGKVVLESVLLSGREVRVLDGSPTRAGQRLLGHEIALESEVLAGLAAGAEFVAAIGDADARRETLERWRSRGHRPVRVVHPSAVISESARLEDGVCVLATAVVQSECRIGEGAIVNNGATIDHDCDIGTYAHVCPGCHLAGAVRVGARAWIGIGSAVREGTVIGEGALVGAGSVVVEDVPGGVTAFGSPCRVVTTTAASESRERRHFP